MKALPVIAAVIYVVIQPQAGARDYLDDLEEFKRRTPASQQQTEIERLLRVQPNFPETYILASNWYFNDGTNVVVFPKNLPPGVYQPETSDSKVFGDKTLVFGDAGLLRDEFVHSEKSQRRAIEILEAARMKFPNRLDIHIGLCSMFNELKEVDREIGAIEEFVSACKKHRTKLLLEYGKPLEGDPITFVEERLAELLHETIKRSTPLEEDLFVAVARIRVREYPQSEVAWNFLAIACLDRGDTIGRYKALKQGLALAPNDSVILKNWLTVNFRLQLLKPARDAANRLLAANPDDNSRQYAEEIIKELDQIEE